VRERIDLALKAACLVLAAVLVAGIYRAVSEASRLGGLDAGIAAIAPADVPSREPGGPGPVPTPVDAAPPEKGATPPEARDASPPPPAGEAVKADAGPPAPPPGSAKETAAGPKSEGSPPAGTVPSTTYSGGSGKDAEGKEDAGKLEGKGAPDPFPSRYKIIGASRIFGAPPPRRENRPGIVGIAGDRALILLPSGKVEFLAEGGEAEGVKVLRIAVNRVLVEHRGTQSELTLFSGLGSSPLLPSEKERRP
jgi:hypothetical protein